MKVFCPFFKEACKGNECVMWKNEKCLIISYIEKKVFPREFNIPPPIPHDYEAEREKNVPEEIKSATEEDLAAELLNFARSKYTEDEYIHIDRELIEEFWSKKGIEDWILPKDINFKLRRVEKLAQNQISEETAMKYKQRKEQELIELPSLVNRCVDWAKSLGIPSLTKTEVKAFLMVENLQILDETREILYLKARVKIKSKIS